MSAFTLVTPVLNGMPWLPEAIASIDRQRSDVDVEHIVFDAGSTDGSREWLERNARRATLVFEPDRGQTDALSKGFARAEGDLLGWLNADDLLEPAALQRVARAFTEAPDAVAVSGGCLLIDGEGALQGAIPMPSTDRRGLSELLAEVVNLPQPATFFRRSAYVASGGLDMGLDLAMDVDLWLKLARVGEIRVLPSDVLARFRVHGGAKTSKLARQMAREDLQVRLRHGLSPSSDVALYLARRAYMPAALTKARGQARAFVGKGAGLLRRTLLG